MPTGPPSPRYLFVGVADEARERRGPSHPAALVRSLLDALHRARSTASNSKCSSSQATTSGSSSWGASGDVVRCNGVHGGRRDLVVACPELSEADAVQLDEMCEAVYGTYDEYGSRLRVERGAGGSISQRLAIGCSIAAGTWQQQQ